VRYGWIYFIIRTSFKIILILAGEMGRRRQRRIWWVAEDRYQ